MEGTVRAPRTRDLLRVLAALSDENRFRIVVLLSTTGRALPSGEVGEALSLSPSLVSHHLSILEAVGVVDRRKVGLCTMNALRHEALTELIDLLSRLAPPS